METKFPLLGDSLFCEGNDNSHDFFTLLDKYQNIEEEFQNLEILLEFPINLMKDATLLNHTTTYVTNAFKVGVHAVTYSSFMTKFIKKLDEDPKLLIKLSYITNQSISFLELFLDTLLQTNHLSVYKNLNLTAAVIIKESFNRYMTLTGFDTKGNVDLLSCLKNTVDFKYFQPFESGHQQLCHLLMKFLNTLYNYCKIDFYKNDINIAADINNLSLTGDYSSTQRFLYICDGNKLFQTLKFISVLFYDKTRHLSSEHLYSFQDDSKTSNNIEIYSNESSSDEESNLLGFLFKEVDMLEGNDKETTNESKYIDNIKASNLYSDYISSVTAIYSFMLKIMSNDHIHPATNLNISIDAIQVQTLAWLFLEVDKELNKSNLTPDNNNQTEISNLNFLITLLKKYIHNISCLGLLNVNLQRCLLKCFDIYPWESDEVAWNSYLSPNLIPILVQSVVTKDQEERELACLSIWRRFLLTLQECIHGQNDKMFIVDDINIEHAYVLVYFFHLMNLMQKKQILLLIANQIIKCKNINTIFAEESFGQNKGKKVLIIGRLLMFFEYILQYLYTPPIVLRSFIDSILWSPYKDSLEKDETVLQTLLDQKNKYYSLLKSNENNINAKLDGLAWNFIICTPEKLIYSNLIDSIMNIFDLSMYSSTMSENSDSDFKYTISKSLNLLQLLPPPKIHLDRLLNTNEIRSYEIIWLIRALHPTTQFHYLFVNSLVKQVRTLALFHFKDILKFSYF